ncbi:conserved protein of unknown function [Legionella pneumophila subsp. pneumophila]|uniref:Uncharacterized protein n=1 Tax=Legionella pneumophila subsp. pneumophila TaxID=91891 RepID=A0AAV2UZG6_LEGPN|nr:conserved protein of unknown function [Legionella pneumophila subsp. pneumophila]
MENSSKEIVLHSQLLENLFAFKSKVSNVFRDVLGIHDVHHISLTNINGHSPYPLLLPWNLTDLTVFFGNMS